MMELHALMELKEAHHIDRIAGMELTEELDRSKSFSISCLGKISQTAGSAQRNSISIKKPRVSIAFLALPLSSIKFHRKASRVSIFLLAAAASAVQFHHRAERKCTRGESFEKVFQSDFYCFLEERRAAEHFPNSTKLGRMETISCPFIDCILLDKYLTCLKGNFQLKGFDLKIPAWVGALPRGRQRVTKGM